MEYCDALLNIKYTLPVHQLTNIPTTRAIPMANVGYHKNDNVNITISPFLIKEKWGNND
jgi:hypothetical protein